MANYADIQHIIEKMQELREEINDLLADAEENGGLCAADVIWLGDVENKIHTFESEAPSD